MRRMLGALALSLLLSAPAAAQEAEAPSPATLGLELIAENNAQGVFELVPAEQLIVVRHGRSGLVCRLDPANTNRLIIFPQAARGEDVACDSTDGDESITLYATRFSFEASLEELLQGAVAAIEHRFPEAREWPSTVEVTSEGLPAQRSAHFMVTRAEDGALVYTRASVAFVGDWAIKLRYSVTAPTPEAAQQGEIASGLLWTTTLSELTREPL